MNYPASDVYNTYLYLGLDFNTRATVQYGTSFAVRASFFNFDVRELERKQTLLERVRAKASRFLSCKLETGPARLAGPLVHM